MNKNYIISSLICCLFGFAFFISCNMYNREKRHNLWLEYRIEFANNYINLVEDSIYDKFTKFRLHMSDEYYYWDNSRDFRKFPLPDELKYDEIYGSLYNK